MRMYSARDSRRENVVRDAARFLGEQLENYARGQDEYFSATVEPRGDYYSSESDPSSRGKVVRIRLPGRSADDRPYVFDGFLSLGADGWEGNYQVFEYYGPTVRDFGKQKTFKSVNEATSFVVRGYADAWKRFGVARDERDSARRRRRFQPTRAEQRWISEKIRTLRHENYEPRQAQAIAYRMAEKRRRRARSRTRR